jgi:thiol-disulfide isomerase/thioredoxin
MHRQGRLMTYQKYLHNLKSMAAALVLFLAPFGHLAMATDKGVEKDALWVKMPVADALEMARRENKPALLYWGAVWCPPCNQLKSQVFSHPEFPSVTQSFVRIYLDGDESGAQEWGDKLNVSGYPTVLVLAPEKSGKKTVMKERLRLAEFVNFKEFQGLVSAALAESVPLKKNLVTKALTRYGKKASLEEWKLLALTWDLAETSSDATDAQVKATIKELEKLLTACPYGDIRGLIAARLLNLDTGIQSGWLDAVLANDVSLYAARGPFVSGAMQWFEKTPAATSKETAFRLLDGVKRLQANPALSGAEKIQALSTGLDLETMMAGRNWIEDKQLEQSRRDAAATALKLEAASKSPFERHAVVSDAAALLASAGKAKEATSMLEREAASSDTPWYYQSSLAALAFQQKDYKAALDWSAKARQSAQGEATKLQWLVSDIVMQSKVVKAQDSGEVRLSGQNLVTTEQSYESVNAWLALARSLPDGFSGRNAVRARKVKDVVATWPESNKKRDLLLKWAETCAMLKNEAAKNCRSIMKDAAGH